MFTSNKIIVVAFACAGLLTACPSDKSSEETGPASSVGETSGSHAQGETGSEPPPSAPAERPESMPLLCSLDGGKWCSGCPQGSTGPLCCADGACTPWDVAGVACAGVVAWCNNYALTDKIASCVD